MLYPVLLYLVAGFFGTLLALRLMAIDAQEKTTILTKRGRIVTGIIIGVIIGIVAVVINGFWWTCDGDVCRYIWGY